MKTPARTDVYEVVKTIDGEFTARQQSLDHQAEELQVLQDRIAAEKVELEAAQEALAKEQAGFAALRAEVDGKIAKIRSDEKLSEDLRAQALAAKQMERELKEAKEEHGIAQLKLEEVAKRELAVSEREKNYKEELKKEFAATLFKG